MYVTYSCRKIKGINKMITKKNIIWSFDIHLYEMNGDQSSGRPRPSDKGVGGGGGDLKKYFFWPKNKWGGGAGPSPGSATAISLELLYVDLQGAYLELHYKRCTHASTHVAKLNDMLLLVYRWCIDGP